MELLQSLVTISVNLRFVLINFISFSDNSQLPTVNKLLDAVKMNEKELHICGNYIFCSYVLYLQRIIVNPYPANTESY